MWFHRLTRQNVGSLEFWRISIILMPFWGASGCLLDYTLMDAEGTGDTDENTEIEKGTNTETGICPHECISKRSCTNGFGGTVDVTLTCIHKKDVCCVTPSGTDLDTDTDADTDADTDTITDPYSDVDTDTGTGNEDNLAALCQGGVEYNGVCYYIGGNGQDCFTACDNYGRSASDHTISVIGSGGSPDNCSTVGRSLMDARLVPFTDNTVKGGTAHAGVGCSWYDSDGEFWYIIDPPTTLGASTNHWRICACGLTPQP